MFDEVISKSKKLRFPSRPTEDQKTKYTYIPPDWPRNNKHNDIWDQKRIERIVIFIYTF